MSNIKKIVKYFELIVAEYTGKQIKKFLFFHVDY